MLRGRNNCVRYPVRGSWEPMARSQPLVAAGALLVLACQRGPYTAPLSHDAYVWQRYWSAPLAAGVAHPPREIARLRVLAREVPGSSGRRETIAVDTAALVRSDREVVAVMRIHDVPRLDAVSIAPLLGIVRAWTVAGVRVRGIEIDHDCPTSHLSGYARWLARERATAPGLGFSITALPTWTNSPDLPRLLDHVDFAVLQVHAIQAPSLFDPVRARRLLSAWADRTRRPFRVALPTYQARLATGEELSVDPATLAAFLEDLSSHPLPWLSGVSWFRLGHAADPHAFSPTTLSALARGERPATPAITARLRAVVPGSHDIALENPGPFDAVAPATLRFSGHLEHLEGVRGYLPRGSALHTRNPILVRAGESVVVGFALGKELALAP